MKMARNNLRLIGKIYLITGASFSAAALIFLILCFINFINFMVFMILAITFGGVGVPFLIVGMCLYLYVRNKEIKEARLKREGIRYDAEILRVIPKFNYYGHYGHMNMSVYAECSYINKSEKTCLVKSDSFLQHNPNEILSAKVYVSRNDPRDYFVEITDGTETDIKFDYDYR